MIKNVRIAVCGELPTACDYLYRMGVVSIDKYMDATEMTEEDSYHLILIYAPNAEGLLSTEYSCGEYERNDPRTIPIRLLNEPCCHSALLELKSIIRRIICGMSKETEAIPSG